MDAELLGVGDGIAESIFSGWGAGRLLYAP